MHANMTAQVVEAAIVLFIFALFSLLPYWLIFSRAGFSGSLSLLMLVPLVGILVLYYVAFARWNVKPEIDEFCHLRRTAG
jgi:uncharacterized membrane protein YhaH (DUF805 family)